MTSNKTFSPTPRDIERHWYVVDADGVVLGRLASEVAKVLRGKHKPIFAPHMDTGDHVIVVNARGIRLTGGKEGKKIYYRHSGYPGGLREQGYAKLLAERPVVAVEKAIRGMLPKNRLGRAMARKLAVYEGPEHPHRAQKPEPLQLGAVPSWDGLPPPKPAPEPRPKAAESKPGTAKRGTAKGAIAKGATAKGATAKGATAKGATAKGATAKGATAKGATAKGATAKGTTAKGTTAKRSTAKAATAEAATAKAATAKRGTAKAATSKRATAEPAAEPESEKES